MKLFYQILLGIGLAIIICALAFWKVIFAFLAIFLSFNFFPLFPIIAVFACIIGFGKYLHHKSEMNGASDNPDSVKKRSGNNS